MVAQFLDSELQLLSKEEIQPVTVVITRRVRPGCEQAYRDWVVAITEAARLYPGHLGTSLILPSSKDDRWIVLYRFVMICEVTGMSDYPALPHRFDSFAHIEAWHTSPERAHHISALTDLHILLDDTSSVEIQTG
jgi:hypothetical protein